MICAFAFVICILIRTPELLRLTHHPAVFPLHVNALLMVIIKVQEVQTLKVNLHTFLNLDRNDLRSGRALLLPPVTVMMRQGRMINRSPDVRLMCLCSGWILEGKTKDHNLGGSAH